MARKKGSFWDEGRRQTLLDLLAAGKSVKQIAEEDFGISYDALRAAMHRHGLGDHLRPVRAWTTTEETEILEDYENGLPVEEIAQKFGVRPGTVYNRVRYIAYRRGVTLKRSWRHYFKVRGKELKA